MLQSVAKGMSSLSETLINNISGSPKSRRASGSSSPLLSQATPGVITVVNCDKLRDHVSIYY